MQINLRLWEIFITHDINSLTNTEKRGGHIAKIKMATHYGLETQHIRAWCLFPLHPLSVIFGPTPHPLVC